MQKWLPFLSIFALGDEVTRQILFPETLAILYNFCWQISQAALHIFEPLKINQTKWKA
jgi:hypothetical protein